MGILDDLKQQKDLKKANENVQEREAIIQQQKYESIVLPKMQQLYFYLRELIDNLNVVDHKTVINNYSTRYPDFGKLVQQNYKISTDGRGGIGNVNELKIIDISYFLMGEGEFVYYVRHKNNIEHEIAFLRASKVNYHTLSRTHGNDTTIGTFKVKRQIPVLFNIAVDHANSNIIITNYNHEDLSTSQKTYDPSEINDQFLDKLARFILRKDRDFFQLNISDDEKDFLKKQAEEFYLISSEADGLTSVNKN